ncbi:ribosome assembly RNA-binding protein YhbY [Thiomicrorhabdus xiamenensis]|uniref:Ribosome assembly RNA-binding protein YhbY n=1 Tax=Thiomicrorhabdus xiamenensis TaxID=2739063 RepID=A0A7D4SY88_9GAMM|nr:ribosome assembly RNA-binding protein YhbY [Thiomicrorhabdus xiamenensis]QKI88864.1 ribosome assembly RNA-binding protein YhbY [Thiomicrorhabdus xiamenensis]
MAQTQKNKITALSPNQLKFLRSIAHNIKPMLIIGSNGLTDSLMAELDSTLSHHELLKIKISYGEREDRKSIVEHILQQTGALHVQTIGKTCVIFRPNEETELPLPRK